MSEKKGFDSKTFDEMVKKINEENSTVFAITPFGRGNCGVLFRGNIGELSSSLAGVMKDNPDILHFIIESLIKASSISNVTAGNGGPLDDLIRRHNMNKNKDFN